MILQFGNSSPSSDYWYYTRKNPYLSWSEFTVTLYECIIKHQTSGTDHVLGEQLFEPYSCFSPQTMYTRHVGIPPLPKIGIRLHVLNFVFYHSDVEVRQSVPNVKHESGSRKKESSHTTRGILSQRFLFHIKLSVGTQHPLNLLPEPFS